MASSIKLRTLLSAFWMSILLPVSVLAQSTTLTTDTLDLDPPEVEHVPETGPYFGEELVITAKISDDRGIEQVIVFFKSGSETEYRKTNMSAGNAPSVYVASIPLSAGQRVLEYYFEATDTGGNRVLNGFPFSPYQRPLDTAGFAVIDGSTVKNGPNEVSDGSALATTSRKTWIYIAVGVLVAGAAIGSGVFESSGSSSDDGSVAVTLNLPVPTE